MRLPRTSRIPALAALLLAAWVGAAVWAFTPGEPSGDTASGPSARNVARGAGALAGNQEPRRDPAIEAIPVFDTSDPRALIGFSENVFVGTVVEKVSEVPLRTTIPNSPGQPQTQFSVDLGEPVLKSGGPRPLRAGDSAVVDQMGGIDPATGKDYVVETVVGGAHFTDQPLEPGKAYIFATRFDKRRGFHTISAQPQGDVLITGNPEGEATLELYKRAADDQVDPLPSIKPGPNGEEEQP